MRVKNKGVDYNFYEFINFTPIFFRVILFQSDFTEIFVMFFKGSIVIRSILPKIFPRRQRQIR